MTDLVALSSRIIDENNVDEPVNHMHNELSELGDGLAIVESFSHSVIVSTDDGLVAFDSSGVSTGRQVTEAIGGWKQDPVRHLVYTHGHVDHIGGSGAFSERWGDPTVYAHENVNPRIDRYELMNDWNININSRQFGGVRGGRLDMSADANQMSLGEDSTTWRGRFLPRNVVRPGVEFEATYNIEIGGEPMEFIHARGETDDHLWAWLPNRRTIMAGDFLIWMFPNAGNPQKVQRYPLDWAAALRAMADRQPELIVPAHGLPIGGTERITKVLTTIADTLETLVSEVVELMNAGATLDTIVHTVKVPEATLALPYLRPLYDEPEFVVRNVWRLYGGWWDGVASRLKPAPDNEVAEALAEISGGPAALIARAQAAADDENLRLACHLADFAGWAAPDDPAIHASRAAIYEARRLAESSLMAKGVFADAVRRSKAIGSAD